MLKHFLMKTTMLLDIKVLDSSLSKLKFHVKAVDEDHEKHYGIKAVTSSGRHLDIKAIDKNGKHYDVKSIITDSSHWDIKVVTPDGEYWPIKIISPHGETHDVKAIDFDNNDQYLHVKGLK